MADQTKTGGTEAAAVTGAITSMGLAEMISNLAIGIAKGQAQLDFECMKIARFMGDAQVAFGKRPGSIEPDFFSLIELGFTPNFYQFVDTVLELRVAVSTKFEETVEQETSDTQFSETEQSSESSSSNYYGSSWGGYGVNWGWGWWNGGYSVYGYSGSASSQSSSSSSFKQKNLSMTTVDAKYASTYNYAVEASSVIKTKIVPVPPPAILEEVIRAKIQERKEWQRLLRLAAEARAIVAGMIGSVSKMGADINKLPQQGGPEGVTPESDKFRQAALELKKGQDSLTNEHWSVAGTPTDRTTADQQVARVITVTEDVQSYYGGSSNSDLRDLKIALHQALDAYAETLATIHTKLAAMDTVAALPAAPK